MPQNKGGRRLTAVHHGSRFGTDFFQPQGKAAESPNPRLRAAPMAPRHVLDRLRFRRPLDTMA